MRYTLLPLGMAFAFGAGVREAQAESECLEVCYDADTMLPVDCSNMYEAMLAVREASEKWECDIRSWTRAPDLIPGTEVPGDTRLALNGTGCHDIVKWELGLRHKERAIIKMSNDDVEFPVKPVRKPFNATAMEERDLERDMNDIYAGSGWSGVGFWDRDEREYEEAMKVYNDAIRNKSLYTVHGKERVLFDTRIELPLNSMEDERVTEHIRPFSVRVPYTNFPPLHAWADGFLRSGGKDEQMLGNEEMFEYYHILHLANGTVLDQPAGRSGFLTEPEPFASSSINTAFSGEQDNAQAPLSNNVEVKKPTLYGLAGLRSPKNASALHDEEDEDLSRILGYPDYQRDQGPDCDRGNHATFSVEVLTNVTEARTDSNVTLFVRVTRSGNGSEYPAFIDMSLGSTENVTFAYEYISTADAYNSLLTDSTGSPRWHSGMQSRMLLVDSERKLEEQREMAQRSGSSTTHYMGDRWPAGSGVSRYDFEEVYGKVGDREEYNFEVDLQIPYDAMPDFEKTFTTILSEIRIDLRTTFLCAIPPDAEEVQPSEAEKLDNEWEEYRLPLKSKKASRKGFPGMHSRGLQHHGTLPFPITRPSSLDPNQKVKLKHYLDSGAKAPLLSTETLSETRPLSDDLELPLVGDIVRNEEEYELKQSRYDLYRSGRQHQPRCRGGPGQGGCWNRNNGGGGNHAAKLWQRKEREQQGGST